MFFGLFVLFSLSCCYYYLRVNKDEYNNKSKAYAREQTLRYGLNRHLDPHERTKIVVSDKLAKTMYPQNAFKAGASPGPRW